MVEIELKSNELKEYVYLKLNKDRNIPLYDEDLDRVENLSLNALDFLDEPTDVTLYDLVFFKNLKSCCIINKDISENELKILNNLGNLKTLQFSSCSIPVGKVTNLNIEYVILDGCCDVNISIFNQSENIKKLRIVNCSNINFDGISKFLNLTDLYIQNMDIENIDEVAELSNLRYLNLNGTSLQKETDFSKNSNLTVEHEKDNFIYDE